MSEQPTHSLRDEAPKDDLIFDLTSITSALQATGLATRKKPHAIRRTPHRTPRKLPGANLGSLVLFAPRIAPAPIKTAADVVFATSELVESILCSLDIRSLARVQRVGIFWRSVIARSPELQQTLFLREAAGASSYVTISDLLPNDEYDYYDELGEPDVDPHPGVFEWTYTPRLSYSTGGIAIYQLHPLLSNETQFDAENRWPGDPADHCKITFSIDQEKLMSWASGPWQNMAISKPNVTLSQVRHAYESYQFRDNHYMKRRNVRWTNEATQHRPATLGHLRELIRSSIEWETEASGYTSNICTNFKFTVGRALNDEAWLVRIARQFKPMWLTSEPSDPVKEILLRPTSKTFRTDGKGHRKTPRISKKLSDMQKSKFDVVCSAHPLLQHLRVGGPRNTDAQGYMAISIDGSMFQDLLPGSWGRASMIQPQCQRNKLRLSGFPDLVFTGKETVTFGWLAKQLRDDGRARNIIELHFKGFVETGAPEIVEARLRTQG